MTDQTSSPDEAWIIEALRVVRRYGPEVLDQVAMLAAGLADTLREPGAATPSDAATSAAPRPATPEVPRLQRIDVED